MGDERWDVSEYGDGGMGFPGVRRGAGALEQLYPSGRPRRAIASRGMHDVRRVVLDLRLHARADLAAMPVTDDCLEVQVGSASLADLEALNDQLLGVGAAAEEEDWEASGGHGMRGVRRLRLLQNKSPILRKPWESMRQRSISAVMMSSRDPSHAG